MSGAPYHNPAAGHDFGCPCCRLPDGCRFFVRRVDGLLLARDAGGGYRWVAHREDAISWRSEAQDLAKAAAARTGGAVVVLSLEAVGGAWCDVPEMGGA